MAIMTRVVMTGRRMKMEAMFIGCPLPVANCEHAGSPAPVATRNSQRCFHGYFTLRRQSNLPIGHHRLPRPEAAVEDGYLLELLRDGDRAHLHCCPVAHHVDILPALTALHRLRRDDDRTVAVAA